LSQPTGATYRRIKSLLRRQTTLVLATADQDAEPRSTPLFFIAGNDLRLYWFSSPASRHSRNCAGNSRASVAVFREARGWRQIRGVQMDGLVSIVADPDLRRELTRKYRARFGLGGDFEAIIRRSALYSFTPARARYVDNSRKFANKIELRLPAGRASATAPVTGRQ